MVLTNQSNRAVNGKFVINMYAAKGSAFDGTQVPIMSLTKDISLKPHKGKAIHFSITSLPSALTAGAYNLLTEVIAPDGGVNTTGSTPNLPSSGGRS